MIWEGTWVVRAIFWLALAGAILSGGWAIRDSLGLRMIQPMHIIGLGLLIAVFGFGWQLYRSGFSGTASEIVEQAATFADRHLSREQKIALSDELKRLTWHPENVTLRHLSGCVECLRYAADFSEAFKWAGWTGKNDTTLDADPELTGVQIVVVSLTEKPHDAELLASALKNAGIEFQWSTWESPLITPVLLFVYPTP